MQDEINKELKALIVGKFGLQVVGAMQMKIDPGILSQVIRHRRSPTADTLAKLRKHLGAKAIDKIFPVTEESNRG